MGFRYIGSKDKLSEIIISEIRFIKKDAKHIIDLMAGTGLFSLALRESGIAHLRFDQWNRRHAHAEFRYP